MPTPHRTPDHPSCRSMSRKPVRFPDKSRMRVATGRVMQLKARSGNVVGWLTGNTHRPAVRTNCWHLTEPRRTPITSALHPSKCEGESGGWKACFCSSRLQRKFRVYCSSTDVGTAADSVGEAAPSKLSGSEIRERFLSFFEANGHTRLPSSSLVPDDPTVLLTIAGMLQFKPIFLGQAPRQHPRATTTQKCVRTNDIENVGVTARHHTFFEMLGNFSFGDYFKKEAIEWAWELSTKVFSLPKSCIWVSVYEDDDEAYSIWHDVVGVPPERIIRMGEEDNFWASGPTGPCGPCSELYFDFHPERGLEGVDLNDDSRFIEYYNLVFMEMNREADGQLTPLKAKNIDTGMGLERMAQILQQVSNNYETDLIFPLVEKAASLAGMSYEQSTESEKRDLKVIGDHTRAVTYLISDGVLPSNVGRGYIVRRLIRRIVMKGQLLGINELFTPILAEIAVSLSDGCDPVLKENAQRICNALKQEEQQFTKTLAGGRKKLNEMMDKCKQGQATAGNGAKLVLSGEDAFMLFDTYGFPLEITQEIVEAEGMAVDVSGFQSEMEAQRRRSKDAREEVDLTDRAALASLVGEVGSTEFLGYNSVKEQGSIVAILLEGKKVDSAPAGSEVDLVLDKTPFYAESGGQIGDQGTFESPSGALVQVLDVQKAGGGALNVHRGMVTEGTIVVGDALMGQVDAQMRQRAKCNHTATHLLQAALKQVLGEETCQQGSLVAFDKLRFDFNLPRGMKEQELEEVERLVNKWIQQAHGLESQEMPLDEAKAAGALAMFGEKYADVVRVVDVPGVSMELCGGTHVANTSEIGGFKILSEGGIQSGVRRIEAAAGPGVVEYLNSLDKVVKNLRGSLKVEPDKIPDRVAALQQEITASKKEIEALKKEVAVAKSEALASKAETLPSGAKILVAQLEGIDGKALQEAAQKLQEGLGDPSAVVLGSGGEGKVSLVAAFSPAVIKEGLNAGNFIGGLAKMCGGGGGGRPNLAQAGGKLPEKLGEALESAESQLKESFTVSVA